METLQFKTTINCTGCLEKVAPFLKENLSPEAWSVDLSDPAKVLTVTTDSVTAENIVEKIKRAGFSIEQIVK